MATNRNTLSKSSVKGNKWHSFKPHWFSKSAISTLWRSKRAHLVVALLVSSAAALTSLGIGWAMMSGNAAAFVSQSVPATMTAGESYAVTVTMLNQGTTTWTPGQAYRLGSQNPVNNTIWGTGRMNLLPGESVSPGATTTFSVVVTAPSSPGSYNFQWQMVRELVEWFGMTTPNIAVQVVPRPATSTPPLRKLREYVYAGGRLITSEEKSCVPVLSPGGASLLKEGGTGSVSVSTTSECNWAATSNAGWITITSGSSGAGNGTVGYSVAANSGAQRSGTITINGQTFNITQAPNPTTCSYTLNKAGDPASEHGGNGSFTLTTGAGCSWTASSNAGWLSVTSAPNGNASDTITYSVAANSGQQRVGLITVGGQTFTVTQAPNQASCTFALSPSSWLYGTGGGAGSFIVTTGAGCFWDANTTDGWITITGGATGVGNGLLVSFNVHANSGGSRTGYIWVRGQAFTITQCGHPQVSPTGAEYGMGGGFGSVTVSAGAGCSTPWSAVSSAYWIQINSGHSGSGNGSVTYTVLSDLPLDGYRSGTLTVAGQTVWITQWAPCGTCLTGQPQPTALNQSATGAGPRGLTARYFGNTTLNGQPRLERVDPSINFNWAGASPDKALQSDRFSARWSGQLSAPTSEAYTFYLHSDGGARLWVNDQLVIDRREPSSEPLSRSAPVELKADAKADIRVEYYKAGGKARIHLQWSSASTPQQIIPQRYLYPEAATDQPTSTDTIRQIGMLLPPGSDAGPQAPLPQLGALSQWLVNPLGRTELVLLIAGAVLVLLLLINWRQARKQLTMAAIGVGTRLRAQIASRLEELFRIAAAVSDKLQFVAGFGKRLFLAAFPPVFKAVSHVGAVMHLGKQKLARPLLEIVRIIARQALSLWRRSGVARLKPALRRALSIALIVILTLPLSPAQADGLARAAQSTWREARAYAGAAANRYGAGRGSDLLNRFINMASSKRPGKVLTAASQAGQVADLKVCPTQLVMFVGERYTLTPIALDANQQVVHGVGMLWSSLGPAIANVSSFGQVEAVAVGTTSVQVQCGNASKQILVEVRFGRRDVSSNQQADIDPTNDCAAEQSSAFASQAVAGAEAQQSLIGDDFVSLDWDPLPLPNSRAAFFRNAVGNPRFSASSRSAAVSTSTQLGSYSYQFNVPVVSVGGRGANAGVGMTLNSRVWNNDDGKLTFNYVGAYPAPGWTIGYGKIIRNYNATATGDKSGMGSGNSPGDYLLVTGDGTRIRLAARYDTATDRWFNEPVDGSFLQFNPISGEMRYPDGSRMIYSSVNGCLLPTAMINSNGGAITMSYRDYCEGTGCLRVFRHRTALSAVRDTLGRYVTFHYYADGDYPANPDQERPAGELAAIKAPDMNGVQQEIIRVEYQPITLKYDFGGAVVDAPANNSQIQVVRRIYYPQTGKGFLFSHYSSYGMPREISTCMNMTGPGGTITDGTVIAYTRYNYTTIDPSDPFGRHQVGSLSDFPQFTRREEWWQGKTDADGAPTMTPTKYDYSRTTDASTEVTTIKYIDKNCEEVTTMGTDSGQLSFGKVISVERKNSTTGAVLSKQVSTYMTGPDGGVQIKEIETIDEAGQGRLVSFGYGPYGRVTDQYEYGYKQGGVYQVRRRTQSEYVDDHLYTDARFLRLVRRVSIYDAAGQPQAKTEYVHDDYAAMGGIESYGLNPSLYPPNHDASYDQNKVIRGNVTAVKTFSRINPEEAAERRMKYDIFGNVVRAELGCCVKTSFGFSGVTAYSQLDWVRSGPETGLNLQTTYQYNYFTGLVDNTTNPDGLLTTYEYDSALRLKKVTDVATGAVAETQVERDGNGNDLLAYIRQTRYDDQGELKVITSKQWFNGAGQVLRAGTGTGDIPDSYDTIATVYDGWGRVAKQSNPYLGDTSGNPQAGVTQFWTKNTYDELSRVIEVTLPDQQTVQTIYNGATATSGATVITKDTVRRTRKIEMDGFMRLVKVTEQNPANGNLEWETTYSYNVLNNLTQINKDGQLRTLTYDNKSRLKSETTPEAGTTTYDYWDFDAIKTRTDARGVVTTYTYGPLNLLTGMSYNTASAPGVAATEPVSINYKTASPGKGQIATVTSGVGSENGESYSYDNLGRLQSCIQVIDGISYEKRYEYNAAGQVTQMTYPSGKQVKMGRDDRGRLSAMQRVDASGGVQESYLSQINYRADGLISSQNFGDGTTESFGYSNERLQLTSQTVMKGGNTLLSLSYGYQASAGQMGSGTTSGNNGQLASVSGTLNGQNRNQAFTYDNVGRLVTATGWGAWERKFDYDPYGNRTKVWDAVSGGNQLQNTVIEQQAGGMKTNRIASVNGTAFSYDASGNVTWDGARTYTYDAENQLVSVSGLSSESYRYNARNRRVKKEAGPVVTHVIWEGDDRIAEYEYGGGATQATGTRYYHQDRLSTRVITGSAGNVVGTTDHLPFGEEIGVSGEEEKHKFTNYERDGTGIDYAVNRHYDPRQGRFNQVDPLGMGATSLADPQSLNLYSYVQNDPINLKDPTGLFSVWPMFVDDGGGGWGGGGGGGFPFGIDPSFWGDRIADLPGFGTQWGSFSALAEAQYEQRVQNTFDANAAKKAWERGDYGRVADILDGNPNVGLSVNGDVFWGQLGGAFARGFGDGMKIASVASSRGLDIGGWLKNAMQSGYESVGKLVRSLRGPDFAIVNGMTPIAPLPGSVGAGIAYARGGLDNPIYILGIGTGLEISASIGWLLQSNQPSTEEVQNWLQGTSFTVSIFKKVGGGVVFTPSTPPHFGFIVGVGIGGRGAVAASAMSAKAMAEAALKQR